MKFVIMWAVLVLLAGGMAINAKPKKNTPLQIMDKIEPEAEELEATIAETEAALEETPPDIETALEKSKQAKELELKLQERDKDLKELLNKHAKLQKKYKKSPYHPELIEINKEISKKQREIEATKKALKKALP